MASPPPGWYDDPARSGRLRYWDGAGWTEHLTDPTPVLPQPSPEKVDGGAVHGPTADRPYDAAADRSTPGQEAGRPDHADAFWPFGGQEPTPTRPLQQQPPPSHQQQPPSSHQQQPPPHQQPQQQPPSSHQHQLPYGQHQQQPTPHRPPQPATRPVAGPRAADGVLLAPWWRRLLAWALDAAVVVAVSILPASFILATRIDQLEVYSRSVEAAASGGGTLPAVPEGLAGAIAACTVVTALIYFLYEVFGLSRFGTTLGRRVLGIRVRVPGQPGHPSFEAASRRAGVKVAGQLAGGVPVLATLGMLFTVADLARGAVDRGRRTLHDLAGATEVVLAEAPSRPQNPVVQPPSAAPQEHRSA